MTYTPPTHVKIRDLKAVMAGDYLKIENRWSTATVKQISQRRFRVQGMRKGGNISHRSDYELLSRAMVDAIEFLIRTSKEDV